MPLQSYGIDAAWPLCTGERRDEHKLLNTLQVPGRDPLDPAERERIRREWDKEIKGHDETRVKWNEENVFWEGESRKWSVWKQQIDHQRNEQERKLQAGKKNAPTGWDCYGTSLGTKGTVPHITHEDTLLV
ncbi:hypothetical protein PHLCEN_2v4615 [Hermanssonia centrifuga]|uniref:Uncharacterized protein n=1 Tax=Hermanssonia centrifuga TaxID=98765 RepID=A0A2R6PMT7_9APHY|nr:hypothetical protein PHLCEN_2v4615 [Hermanssonia centrifuga]